MTEAWELPECLGFDQSHLLSLRPYHLQRAPVAGKVFMGVILRHFLRILTNGPCNHLPFHGYGNREVKCARYSG